MDLKSICSHLFFIGVSMYILVEGADGTGKTTMINTVVDILQSFGHAAVSVSEPGTTPIATKIRRLIKDNEFPEGRIGDDMLLLLFSAARCESLAYVRGLLDEGKIVISDRSVVSSMAYQCIIGSSEVELLSTVSESLGLHNIPPDLIINLELTENELRKNKNIGGDAMERRYCNHDGKVENDDHQSVLVGNSTAVENQQYPSQHERLQEAIRTSIQEIYPYVDYVRSINRSHDASSIANIILTKCKEVTF